MAALSTLLSVGSLAIGAYGSNQQAQAQKRARRDARKDAKRAEAKAREAARLKSKVKQDPRIKIGATDADADARARAAASAGTSRKDSTRVDKNRTFGSASASRVGGL